VRVLGISANSRYPRGGGPFRRGGRAGDERPHVNRVDVGYTWNPTTGCDQVSDGCDRCYALTLAKRLKAAGNSRYQRDGNPRTSGVGFGLTLHHDKLEEPLRWRRPRLIFVNSMSDLFHGDVPDGFVAAVFANHGSSRATQVPDPHKAPGSNGVSPQPAFGQYKPSATAGIREPWSLQVLEVSGDRIGGITFFLDTERWFPLFGLPPRLEG
jgi:hypothetical protein